MIVNVEEANHAYRLQRTFKYEIYLIAQVRQIGPNVVISHDQGGVLNGVLSLGSTNNSIPPDGLVLNSQNSAPPGALWADFFWQGELWYAADIPGTQFSVEMGTETSQRKSGSAIMRTFMFLFG